MITKRGAWFTFYRRGMAGTLGLDLDSDSDNLGWAIRSWKYELAREGFRGKMVLDSPIFGDSADAQTRLFQTSAGLEADGVIGPHTGKALLAGRIAVLEVNDEFHAVHGMVAHESGFDLGAIGWADPFDRGLTQRHLAPQPAAVTLSQAIRPAYALPVLSWQLLRIMQGADLDVAVASWNIGEGSAEWWHEQGKPAQGSPSWWDAERYGDMSERATAYVAAVRHKQQEVPR